MYTVNCILLTDKTSFDKTFDSYYQAAQFVRKCKYSKRIRVVGYNFVLE